MCSTAMLLSTFQKKNRTLVFFVSHVNSGTTHSVNILQQKHQNWSDDTCAHCKNKRVTFNPAGGVSVASSLPKNVHTGRSITLCPT